MNIKHQSIILDVNKANVLPNIIAHQGDKKTRFVDVTLTMSGEELILNDSYRAILKASNNGETKAINDCEIDLEQNIIVVELTDTMLDTAGFLNCEITVIDNDKYITSQNFIVEVSLSTISEDEEIKKSKEYGTLVSLMDEVAKIENDAKAVKDMISHLAEIKDIDSLVNSKADKEETKNQLSAKENIANKQIQITFPSTTYYPTTKAVWDFVESKLKEAYFEIKKLNELLVKVTTTKSKNVTLNDSSNSNIVGLTVYGNSTQSAVPSPTNPVEIVSVENPGITISSDSESQNITTECTLRGINNICDTLTVNCDGTGYITQRLVYEQLKSGKSSSHHSWQYSINSCRFYRDDSRFKANYGTPNLMCNYFETKNNEKDKTLDNTIGFTSGNGSGVAIRMNEFNGNISAFENWLDENEVYVLVPLKEPIVTDLSKAEVDKILSLHTYYPSSTINSNADFQATYIADTKNYIDNKVR